MFRVTFNVSAGRLEKLLQAAKLIKMPDPEIVYNGEAKGAVVTVKKRANGEQIVSLTGKKATKGSMREKMLTTLEKLEVRHGVGTITRYEFRGIVEKKDQDPQIIYQLIREGYIKTL